MYRDPYPLNSPKDADAEEFQKLYGRWASVTPTDVADSLADFDAPWWIAGGWAIDAATGRSRDHEDIDVGMFRRDVGELVGAIAPWHVWSVGPDGLRPVTVDDEPADSADQVWLRRDADSPWLLDVLITRDRDGLWMNKRTDAAHPLESVTWMSDGVRYLNPEIVLMFKAKAARPKDTSDVERAWPVLDESARSAPVEYLRAHHPDHPWLGL